MRREDEPGGRRIDDQVDWSEVLDWEERQDSTLSAKIARTSPVHNAK